MRPTIGITCDYESVTNRRGMAVERHLASEELVLQVAEAGAKPVLLPHLPEQVRQPPFLEGLDGLIVSGGDFDVPPALFGQSPHPKLGRLRPARTSYEMALLTEAWLLRLPILGLCGGMQLINVHQSGTLFQDVSLRPNTEGHEQPHDTRVPHHPISLAEKSRLAGWLGATALDVNSTHHQMVDQVAPNLIASAWAPDGVIEAVETQDKSRIVLGVQWHPEMLSAPEQKKLFACFVDACAQQKFQ